MVDIMRVSYLHEYFMNCGFLLVLVGLGFIAIPLAEAIEPAAQKVDIGLSQGAKVAEGEVASIEGDGGEIGQNVNVRIRSIEIAPTAVLVNPGTTVIWVNDTSSPLKVKFVSRAVSTTCKAPLGFIIGRKGIYESKELNSGSAASLCFLEKGKYEYVVIFPRDAVVEKSGESADGKTLLSPMKGLVEVGG
ncbi:MAG: hypothetical protein IT291_10705 [Deltaproteobacteria bacterium]|nr:hypothetical protein [Deltaproteobacteria bacterium]